MRLVMNALSTILTQVLEDQQLSIREAAERSGIPMSRFSEILYGRSLRPKPETLQALSNGLGISYRTLALAAYGIIHDTEPVAVGA